MGRTKRLLGLGVVGAIVIPPIGAAIAKRQVTDIGDETSSEVRVAAFFDGRRWTSRAIAFREGSIVAAYSGVDIDLRGAELDAAGAHLEVLALFSGVRVLVPAGWQTDVHSSLTVMGGVDDETDGSGTGPILEVDVRCLFSGVTVTTREDGSPLSIGVTRATASEERDPTAFERAETEAAEAAEAEGPEVTTTGIEAGTDHPNDAGSA